jgi:photosystem II stability/assembly factor-like uncharacterized protein
MVDGVYRSTDGGGSWNNQSDGLGVIKAVNRMAIAPDGMLFSGLYGNGVFR